MEGTVADADPRADGEHHSPSFFDSAPPSTSSAVQPRERREASMISNRAAATVACREEVQAIRARLAVLLGSEAGDAREGDRDDEAAGSAQETLAADDSEPARLAASEPRVAYADDGSGHTSLPGGAEAVFPDDGLIPSLEVELVVEADKAHNAISAGAAALRKALDAREAALHAEVEATVARRAARLHRWRAKAEAARDRLNLADNATRAAEACHERKSSETGGEAATAGDDLDDLLRAAANLCVEAARLSDVATSREDGTTRSVSESRMLTLEEVKAQVSLSSRTKIVADGDPCAARRAVQRWGAIGGPLAPVITRAEQSLARSNTGAADLPRGGVPLSPQTDVQTRLQLAWELDDATVTNVVEWVVEVAEVPDDWIEIEGETPLEFREVYRGPYHSITIARPRIATQEGTPGPRRAPCFVRVRGRDAVGYGEWSTSIRVDAPLQPKCKAPRVIPAGGNVHASDVIQVESETAHAKVRYTLDGTVPDSGSRVLASAHPSLLEGTEGVVLLTVIAQRAGFRDSEPVRFVFNVFAPHVGKWQPCEGQIHTQPDGSACTGKGGHWSCCTQHIRDCSCPAAASARSARR